MEDYFTSLIRTVENKRSFIRYTPTIVDNVQAVLAFIKVEDSIMCVVYVSHPLSPKITPIYEHLTTKMPTPSDMVELLERANSFKLCLMCNSSRESIAGLCELCYVYAHNKVTYDEECAVCLTPNNLTSTTLNCKHKFHGYCLTPIVESENGKFHQVKCPMCRQKSNIAYDTFKKKLTCEHWCISCETFHRSMNECSAQVEYSPT